MKKCPKCNTVYDDSKNFCTKDGTKLVEFSSEPPSHDEQKPKPQNKIFRKIVIALIIVVVVLYALVNWALNSATYIRLSPETQIFSRDGQSFTMDVETDGYTWEVIHHPNWVKISDENVQSNKLEIYVMSNKGGDDREGTIEVKSGKCSVVMQVGQWSKAKKLDCDKSTLTFKKSPGRDSWQSVKITSDINDFYFNKPDWTEVEETNNGFRVKCESNDDYDRTGYLTVRADDLSRSITIRQQGKCRLCNGTGELNTTSTNVCLNCCLGFVYGIWGPQICSVCGGTGFTTSSSIDDCTYCNGTGVSQGY